MMNRQGTASKLLRYCVALLAIFYGSAFAQDNTENTVVRGATSSNITTPFVFKGDLRNLPVERAWRPGDAIKEIPKRRKPPAFIADQIAGKRDPLLDRQTGVVARAFDPAELSFNGQGFTGVNPPDTVGDIGPNYYIQSINSSGGSLFTIHDKSNGNVVAGPLAMEALGSGFCSNGAGDPIVLYDELADRWLLSEFSSSGNRLCVYISQGPDPINDGYYNYDFQAPSFPDYPKYGVWTDAYYVGTNETSSALYALDRNAMLNGQPATFQRVAIADLGGFGFQMATPSDIDGGVAPPNGSPNYFMRHRDDESHNSGANANEDYLEIFEFAVDFNNAANTTVTGPISIAIAEIDSSLCGLTSFSCIRQPGTNTTLDPLREVTMWRVQYRNFGTHETLVGNLATDVNGSDQSGIRWFELRRSGGPWALHQEGTYAPDADSRWMGSAAMDGSGNIAVGYNVSSSSTFPGLRYAARNAGDALGTLTLGEASLVEGTSSNASNRYGDYASLNVDPSDDCTFWFTGEFNSSSSWSTRIGKFKLDSCSQLCGNGVIDSGEVCDGGELDGNSCSTFGCGGGTLSCNASCSGFDTSACTTCPAICGNGQCETGEDCGSCASDCPSFTVDGASCGNGICEAGNGENCSTCAVDCTGRTNGPPSDRFCCGDGDCSDSRCNSGGFSCTTVPSNATTTCCGDLTCEGPESSSNCALDCGSCSITEVLELSCGDGIDNDCDGNFDCDDSDCAGSSECSTSCSLGQLGDSCNVDSECCSNKCKGPNGRKTCK